MHGTFDGLGRFAEPWLLILTSLADGPKHGYAIMADVAAFSGVRMEPGALYRALSRLECRGWVRPLATGERRRSYEIAATWPMPGRPGDAADVRANPQAGRTWPSWLTPACPPRY
ncbi:MAG TPA: helix-turn-helix transcriptional regulator [Streptosporangiaceae bacterium]